MSKTFSPLDIQELSFWVKTSDIRVIGLRMVDSTGQVHQQRIYLEPTDDWQKVTVTDFSGGHENNHWGGANDGVWHPPARQVYILMDKSRLLNGQVVGEMWVDDVAAAVPVPDLAIEQVKLGNVFAGGENADFRVLTQGDTVVSRVTDFWGTPVAELSTPVVDGRAEISIPGLDNGYYILKVTAMKDGSPIEEAENSFAVLPPFDLSRAGDSPFGMATHFGQAWDPEMIPLIQLLGAKNIRDELYWGNVEPQKGVYAFPERYDQYMDELAAHHIKPFIIFSYTNPNYDNNSTPYTDEGRQGFANYGKAIVERYDTEWVEVYNEFNIAFGDRGDGPADSRPDYYFELLKTTYETVKAADPDTVVVGAATAGVPWEWLEELFQLGGLDYMDALSIHPYRYPGEPEGLVQDLEQLQDLVKTYNNGQMKPVWITELGWPTQTGARGVDENTQAQYIVRSHVLSLSEGIEKIFWYDFKNDGLDPAYNEHNFGIVRNEGDSKGKYAPKPAYVAYATMARQLTGKAFSHQEDIGEGIYSYVFSDGSGDTRVIWSQGLKNVKVKTDGPITVTDLMGRAETFHPMQGGYVYLTVSDAPLYIEGALTNITESSKFTLTGSRTTAGETLSVKLTLDNTEEPLGRITADFEIAGQTYQIDVMPHEQDELRITLPGLNTTQTVTLFGYIRFEGQLAGKLMAEVQVVDPVSLQVKHVLRDGQDNISVDVYNERSTDYSLDRIEWEIGSETGNLDTDLVIPADSGANVNVPVPDLPSGQSYPVKLALHSPDAPPVVHEGNIHLVGLQDMIPFAQQTITVDAVLDDLSGVPSIDLADGEVKIGNYHGEDDLSGQLWVTWDPEHLYISAQIQDDVFSQTGFADGMWQGDSIQFAVSQGMPGDPIEWYEYGLALTASGEQVYRWMTAQGLPVGAVDNAQARIVRDEAAKQTIYEFALPWSELVPIAADDGMLSFSILVNDNDGTGRKGWIEWGSGIGGSKDNKLFKPIRLE